MTPATSSAVVTGPSGVTTRTAVTVLSPGRVGYARPGWACGWGSPYWVTNSVKYTSKTSPS